MMRPPGCQLDLHHLKEDNFRQQPLFVQAQAAPPPYTDKNTSMVTPLYSPPPPYTEASPTSFSSRLVTILTLAILLLTSVTIGVLWKHMELLSSLTVTTHNIPTTTPLQLDHPTLPEK